ncbi:MAG TPA: type II toxin-antitoxin system VapC family toxin [Bryobacteraceae bacterium]|jgi:ribonuclease VapC|nr:type II toxin-antitoxin system VapC family toxin [Bryobacteraceae bacterium]
MILDTSALLAILLNEPEARRFASAIETADVTRISAASYVEAAIYVDRNGDEIRRAMLDTFLAEFSIRIEAVTAEHALIARQAFVFFGKGRHKAGLNFGDCFSYALSKAYREPLLFKGGDFGHTDLETVN